MRVDTLTIDFDSPKIMGHWEEIMNRINSGDMPPEKEARPKPDDVAKVAEWIAGATALSRRESRIVAGVALMAFDGFAVNQRINRAIDCDDRMIEEMCAAILGIRPGDLRLSRSGKE